MGDGTKAVSDLKSTYFESELTEGGKREARVCEAPKTREEMVDTCGV